MTSGTFAFLPARNANSLNSKTERRGSDTLGRLLAKAPPEQLEPPGDAGPPDPPPPPGLQVPGREGAWQELLSALFLESLDGSGTKSADPSYLIPHLPCFCEI